MPPLPKLRDVPRKVRHAEIRHQPDAEKPGRSDGDVAVPTEIAIQLEHEIKQPEQQRRTIVIELAVRKIRPVAGAEEEGAERPTSSVLTCKKILNTFGIRQRPWRVDLQRLIREIYGEDGSKVPQPTVETKAEELGS